MSNEKQEKISIEFGEQLRRLRNAKGWSLRVAADKIGIGKSTLFDYENDEYKESPRETLKNICDVYGIDYDTAYTSKKVVLDISQYSEVGYKKAIQLHMIEMNKNINIKTIEDENAENKK